MADMGDMEKRIDIIINAIGKSDMSGLEKGLKSSTAAIEKAQTKLNQFQGAAPKTPEVKAPSDRAKFEAMLRGPIPPSDTYSGGLIKRSPAIDKQITQANKLALAYENALQIKKNIAVYDQATAAQEKGIAGREKEAATFQMNDLKRKKAEQSLAVKNLGLQRSLLRGASRFRFEYLGVMFAGMAIQKAFGGIVKNATQANAKIERTNREMGKMLDSSVIFKAYIDLTAGAMKLLGSEGMGFAYVLGQGLALFGQMVLFMSSLNSLALQRVQTEVMVLQAKTAGLDVDKFSNIIQQSSLKNLILGKNIRAEILRMLGVQVATEKAITAENAKQAALAATTGATKKGLMGSKTGAVMVGGGGGKMAGLAGMAGMAAMLAGMSGAAGDASDSLTQLGSALTMVSVAMMIFQGASGAMAGILGGITGAIGGITGALSGAGAAVSGFLAAIGPIGWVILAITAIIGILIAFKDQVVGFFKGVGDAAGKAFDGLKKGAYSAVKAAGNWFNWLGLQLGGFWKAVTAGLGNIWKGLTDAWNTFWTGLQDGWNTFWAGVGSVIDGIWTTLVDTWNGFWQGLQDGWNGFWGGLATWGSQVWDGLSKAWNDFWNGLITGWGSFWNGIGIWLGQVWDGLVKAWGEFWNGLGIAWGQFWNGVGIFLGQIWDGMIDAWNGFWGTLTSLWNDFWGGVGSFLGGIWQWMVDGWNGFWNGLVNGWNDFWGGVGSFLGGIWDGLVNGWNNFWGGLTQGWNSFWAGAGDVVNNILDGITNGIQGVKDWLGIGDWQLPDLSGILGFAQGGIVSNTGPALVHAGEMVLPADITKGLMNAIGGGPVNLASQKSTESAGGGSITINLNGVNVASSYDVNSMMDEIENRLRNRAIYY